MTEQPKFQTPPLPPHAPAFGAPRPIGEPVMSTTPAGDLPADNFAKALKLPVSIFKTKIMAAILGGSVLLGVLLGALFFGGGTPPPSPQQGLLGIVRNPDMRQDLPRCGTVSEGYPCVVYIVNHSRNDRYAEYFFDEATRLTGRQKYLVTIENQQYAKSRIPPGWIAQVKIPSLK